MIRTASTALPNWAEHRDQLRHEHNEILAAIESGDAAAAANLVELHIRRAYVTLGITGVAPTAD